MTTVSASEQLSKLKWLVFSTLIVMGLEVLSFWKISLPPAFGALFYGTLICVIGWETLQKGFQALLHLNFKSINLLMLIAVAGAFYLGDYEEAAVVIVLFSLAEHLEESGISKSKSALNILLNQMPKKILLKDSNQLVDVESVKVSEIIRVKPGQMIPLDGKVIGGASFVDESTITGEPIPQDKRPGDMVYAGTLNNQGYIDVLVSKEFQNTALAKIRQMTFQSSQYKAETQRFIEHFSSYYTPAILVLALFWMSALPLIFARPFQESFYQALNLLVIACPCALVISTPIAIFSAIGSASKRGVLIKGGKFLEALGRLSALALDKTRTLTKGKPFVSEIIPLGKKSREGLLACAAGIEKLSEHPLAASIVEAAEKENLALHSVENFESFVGKGAKADCLVCYDRHHCIGKLQFIMEEHGVPQAVLDSIEELQNQGKSVIVVSTNHSIEGLIALEDELRPDSKKLIDALKELHVHPVMLTGDHKISANVIAEKLGIKDVRSELLPEEKGVSIQELLTKYQVVGMVGDGVNDGPALALSSVGISMAELGSDTALEAASVVLLNDNLLLIPELIKLSRRTLTFIIFNTFFAVSVKIAVVILALLGMTNLAMAIFADVGVTLIVILNSLRLMRD
ncbi:putative cadmium-transporting ATPase [Chlamydiales bacterium STE3]|nr:putative cadmium-transporting ATPase [Chlamydiales bacterium STE3]